jgi:hypothetical protein
MLDRKGDARQRDRRAGRRRPPRPEPVPPSSTTRWLGVAVLVLVALIVVGRLQRPAEIPSEVTASAPAEPPLAEPVATPAMQSPLPATAAVAETPTLDLLVRLEARRRIQRAGNSVYVDSLLAESDSVLRRWPERPGEPVTVAVVRDSLFLAAGEPVQLVRDAFERWQALRLGVEFAFISDTSTARIVVGWRDQFTPEEQRTGQTDLEAGFDGTIQRARITLALRAPDGTRLDRQAMLVTAAHETGHALGLAHSGRPGDLMYPTPRSAALSDRDRQTALLIYGLPAGSVKGQ